MRPRDHVLPLRGSALGIPLPLPRPGTQSLFAGHLLTPCSALPQRSSRRTAETLAVALCMRPLFIPAKRAADSIRWFICTAQILDQHDDRSVP